MVLNESHLGMLTILISDDDERLSSVYTDRFNREMPK